MLAIGLIVCAYHRKPRIILNQWMALSTSNRMPFLDDRQILLIVPRVTSEMAGQISLGDVPLRGQCIPSVKSFNLCLLCRTSIFS